MYITVQDWMMTLPLGKVELLIYAHVYDLTKHGKFFDGSAEYLARMCGCKERMVRHAVEKLVDGGYLRREKGLGRQRSLTACEPPPCGNTLPREAATDCRKSGNTLPQKRQQIAADSATDCRENGNTLPRPFLIEQSRDNQVDNQVYSQVYRDRPTREDITKYCEQKGLRAVDPKAFAAYYEERGWTTDRGPVKNWRKLLEKWDEDAKRKRAANDGRSYTLDPAELRRLRGEDYETVEGDDLPF